MSLRKRRGISYKEPTKMITMVMPTSFLEELDQYVMEANTSRTRFVMELFHAYKGKVVGEFISLADREAEPIQPIIDDIPPPEEWAKVYLNGG